MTQTTQRQLKKAGLVATTQRIAVLEALGESKGPIDATWLTNRLGIAQPSVDRVLQALCEANLVRRVDLRLREITYELADPNDHHHLVCTECRTVEAFHGCEADRLAARALQQSKSFAAVTAHAFELFGVCKRCQGA